MNKATFTSTDPSRTPTYWIDKNNQHVMWKVGLRWNRMYNNGHVDDNSRISVTPDTYPDRYVPCYGDLVITISADT